MSAIKSDISDAGIPGGPLRKLTRPNRNAILSLAYCPICGPEVSFEGKKKPSFHIAEHDPEDFGLTPLGEGSE